MEEIIKDKLKQAPKDPGDYQFLNSEKKIRIHEEKSRLDTDL